MGWHEHRRTALLGILLMLALAAGAGAQGFSSGSTGVDGAYNPTGNTTLTLSPSGVFNFTTITIPAGVTVTIGRNALNTPATLLATGDVTIAGTLELSGAPGGNGVQATATAPNGGAPGPGGAWGGSGATAVVSSTGGAGQGPGGGSPGVVDGGTVPHCGGGGGGHNGAGGTGPNGTFAVCGTPGGPAYGGARLLPLLGGSGGGGGSAYFGGTGAGGGGGAGALLLASSTKITLTGRIYANGGAGGGGASYAGTGGGGGGSAGAMRLVAPLLTGTGGVLQVVGGTGGGGGYVPGTGGANWNGGAGGTGATGRIRLEASTFQLNATMTTVPSQGPLGLVRLPATPGLQFTSVAGLPVPASPQGSYATPDLILPATFANPAAIELTGAQIPPGTVVTVRSLPLQGAPGSATAPLTGTLEASTASVTLNLSTTQPTVLTAEATFPLIAGAGEGPLYAEGPVPSMVEGEEVTHIRVVARLGGESLIRYLTSSGREVVLP